MIFGLKKSKEDEDVQYEIENGYDCDVGSDPGDHGDLCLYAPGTHP